MIFSHENTLLPSPLTHCHHPIFKAFGIKVYFKRDDLIDPVISGNKFRKLKYNIKFAEKEAYGTLLSFGGAYSNHLYAMAGIAQASKLQVVMFIRGDELTVNSNKTLETAHKQGVKLLFVSRKDYRNKEQLTKLFLKDSVQKVMVIPEGGSNRHALKGMSEMVHEIHNEIKPTHICCSAGTGGTAAGIIAAQAEFSYKTIIVPSLKNGFFLKNQIADYLSVSSLDKTRTQFLFDYHFGGYGKFTKELLRFIEGFEGETGIYLEQVYTGKLVFAITEEIKKGNIPIGSTLVIYHSGGLQGRTTKLSLKTRSQ